MVRSSRGLQARRLAGRVLRVVLVLSVLVAGYLVFVAVRRREPVVLPAPAGRHPVGRAMYEWVDRSRLDPLGGRPGSHRELSVWLWYPASAGAGSTRAPYAPGQWGQLHLQGPLGFFEGPFSSVRSHARAGGPVAAGRFPVVLLEPGLGFSAPQYTVLAEDLASRGYVVAGVTPTYSAHRTVLHGRSIPSTTAGNPPDLGGHTGRAAAEAERLVQVWAADARFVAGVVTGLDRSGPLTGHIGTAKLAYLGHSFGGAAALQACSTDRRCAGAVDVDGTQFGSVVRSGLHVPLLILGSDNSCVTGRCRTHSAEDRADRRTAQLLLAASTGPTRCSTIPGTRHLNFTDDAALYLAPPVRSVFALGSIDGKRGLTLQNAAVAAFLDQVLRHAAPFQPGLAAMLC